VIGRLLLAGFALLTAGLVVGAVCSRRPPGVPLPSDWKVLWSIFVWLLYLVLLVLHWPLPRLRRRFV